MQNLKAVLAPWPWVAWKSCSNPEQFVSIIDRIPTADLQVYHDGAWRCIPRVGDNFFEGLSSSLPNLPMKFPLKVQFTSIAGETLTAFLNTTVNGVYHETGVQYQSLNQCNILFHVKNRFCKTREFVTFLTPCSFLCLNYWLRELQFSTVANCV